MPQRLKKEKYINKKKSTLVFNYSKYISAIPKELAFISLILLFMFLKWSALEFTVLKYSESYAEILPFTSAGELWWILFTNTVRMTAYSAACLMIPAVFISLLPRKTMTVLYLIYDTFITLLIYADIIHIRHFSQYLSCFKIGLVPQLLHVVDAVFSLMSPVDLLLFVDFIVLLPLIKKLMYEPRPIPVKIKGIKIRTAAAFMVFVMTSFAVLDVVQLAYSKSEDLYNTQNMGLAAGSLIYHIVDVHYFIKDRLEDNVKMTPDEEQEFTSWYKNLKSLETSDIKNPYAGIAKGKNIIVIQVESLQGFVVELNVNGVEITPNINKIIKHAMYFPDIYDQTLSGGTSDTEFMINTGMYPTPDTTVFNHHSDSEFISLPLKLKEHNYKSYVFHADRKDFWNRDVMYKSLGYDQFFDRDHYNMDERIGLGLSDESFFKQTLEKMSKLKGPFYASVITLSSHTPFDSYEFIEKAPKELSFLKSSYIDNYLRSINYTDKQIGMFINGLEKKGILKDSLLIITGDHSAIPVKYKNELFSLLGLTSTPALDYVLWRNLHKVPLIIRPPNPWNERIVAKPRPGGQVDILPTLSYLMDIKFPVLMGNNLLVPGNGSIVLRSDRSFIIDNMLIIPEKGLAVNMTTGEYNKTTGGDFGTALQRSLKYNDYIIKKNLVPLIIEKHFYNK